MFRANGTSALYIIILRLYMVCFSSQYDTCHSVFTTALFKIEKISNTQMCRKFCATLENKKSKYQSPRYKLNAEQGMEKIHKHNHL